MIRHLHRLARDRAADLEDAVLGQTRRRLLNGQLQDGEQAPSTPRPASVTTEEGQRRRLIRYVKQATDGTITLHRLRALVNGLNDQRSAADMDTPPVATDAVDAALWDTLDFAARRNALHQWLERVVVGDAEIEVHLRTG